MDILEKVNTDLRNLQNHKVLLKDPVRPNEGPWLVMDSVGGSFCVPRVCGRRGKVSTPGFLVLLSSFAK